MKKVKLFLVALLIAVLLCPAQTVASLSAAAAGEEEWDVWSDTWALTDALGRKAADYREAGGTRGQKYVGMFYFVWHDKLMEIASQVDAEAPRNITKIIQDNPDSFIYDQSLWGPESSMHYWGEPLYGYYNLDYDEFVIRAHALLLANAGIDYIIIDSTNFYGSGIYNESADNVPTIKKICDVYRQMTDEGQIVPKISMLTTWLPASNGPAINYLYDNLYANPDYADLWFRYEGKPLMLGDPSYVREDIRDFFTYRRVQPELSEVGGGAWNWLAKYPQEVSEMSGNVKECMAVGVAQNWNDALVYMTDIDEYGRFTARGRSWTSSSSKLLTDPTSEEYHSEYGYNFQEQFDRALNIDPDMLFITGWNEWIAGRFTSIPNWANGNGLPNRANFGDCFTTEFSRDIEMTREGNLGDNFYNQLVENVRLFKGVKNTYDYGQTATVTIDGNFSDWAEVNSYYRDSLNDKVDRDAKGIGKNHYTNKSGRNDFKQFKVARDSANVYFYIETMDDITEWQADNWMTLFLKTDESADNWEGYNYVLGRAGTTADTMRLERSKGGWNFETVSSVNYKVSGNAMELAIPLSELGLAGEKLSFEFKFFDNMQVAGDVYEFYLSGDAAPNARFNYVYDENSRQAGAPSGINLYDEDAERTEIMLSGDDTAGVMFTASHDFLGIDVCAYNVFNRPASYTLSIYRFEGSYASTTANQPLYTRKVENVYNNDFMYLGSSVGFAAGDYLLVVSDVECDADNIVGLYLYENQDVTRSYLQGKTVNASFKARLYYAAAGAAEGVTSEASLTDGNASTYWEAKQAGECIVLDMGSKGAISGFSLTPYLENGQARYFPEGFTVYSSDDGVTYTKVPKQAYERYFATGGEQTFWFSYSVEARYLKITVDDLGGDTARLTAADILVRENLPRDNENPDDSNHGCGGCGGSVSAVLLAAVILPLAAIFKRKF